MPPTRAAAAAALLRKAFAFLPSWQAGASRCCRPEAVLGYLTWAAHARDCSSLHGAGIAPNTWHRRWWASKPDVVRCDFAELGGRPPTHQHAHQQERSAMTRRRPPPDEVPHARYLRSSVETLRVWLSACCDSPHAIHPRLSHGWVLGCPPPAPPSSSSTN